MNLLVWAKRFIGVCCVCLFLFFMWLLIGYTRSILENMTSLRGIFNLIVIALLTSLTSAALLFGTAGASLLTGKYQKHRYTLHRTWLILGLLSFFLFLSVLSAVPTP